MRCGTESLRANVLEDADGAGCPICGARLVPHDVGRFAEHVQRRLRSTHSEKPEPGERLRAALEELAVLQDEIDATVDPLRRGELEAERERADDVIQSAAEHTFAPLRRAVAEMRREKLELARAVAEEVLAEGAERWARMDLVGFAEDVAGDQDLAWSHELALEEGTPSLAARIADGAAVMIIARASRARTRMGRSVAIQQAEKVFQLMRRKAQRFAGVPEADRQALWCAALSVRLGAARAHRR